MQDGSARRSIATIVVSLAIVTCSVAVIKASEMSDFCSSWNNSLEPEYDFWCDAFNWSWTGGYDLTGMDQENVLFTAAAICDDLVFSCWDTCDSAEYRAWALTQVNAAAWPNCEYDISCIEGYSNPSCQQGTAGDFSCSCQYMNVCMPC